MLLLLSCVRCTGVAAAVYGGASKNDAGAIALWRADSSTSGRQLLAQPGFESTGGWEADGEGFTRVHVPAHTGAFSIRCENRDAAKGAGAGQTVVLDQKVAAPILAEAWSRSETVSGSPDSDYSLYLDLTFQDGSNLWGQTAAFGTGSHGWEHRQVLIFPPKPIRLVRVSLLLRHHTGTVWFDDAVLRELSPRMGVGFFDGVAVDLNRHAAVRPVNRTRSIGGAGFRLELNEADGRPVAYSMGARSVALASSDGAAGILARDAGAGTDFYALRSKVMTQNGRLAQEGALQAIGLKLHVTYTAIGGGVEIAGQVDDTTGRDRAITVYFALPVSPAGAVWWDTLRQRRPVGGAGIDTNTVHVGVGATGEMSRYPLTCLQVPGADLDLAVPMDLPRVTRLAYDPGNRRYYAAIDLGLARGAPGGTFQLVLYGSKASDGMRGALTDYYRIFAPSFRKRVQHEGIWMPFSKISRVPNPQDFGFAFKEGDDEVAWDDAHNVYTFRYTEPMSWWMTMPPGADRSYDGIMDYLAQYASGKIGTPETRSYARAVQDSGDFQSNGHYVVSAVDAPWAHGALFINNCNPDVPDRPDFPNRAHVAWSESIAHSLYDSRSNGVLDGEYLDSLEGWADTRNFRREQYPHESEPLTFDTDSLQVCILQAISTFEFTRWMAAEVHRRGKLMFANSTPWRFFWYAPLLDVMGTETNWLDDSKYHPESDEMMLYRRMVCYHKPYLLLMNTDFDRFDHTMVDRYMQRSLFYGIFPSMFSHNAADHPYWENALWYNRDRDLFRKYIPIIRDLSERGWEPVTRAHTTNPDVWVERFGGEAGRPVAFTLLNSSLSSRVVQLRLEAQEPHGRIPPDLVDRISGIRHPVRQTPSGPSVTLTLGSQAAAALFSGP